MKLVAVAIMGPKIFILNPSGIIAWISLKKNLEDHAKDAFYAL
jgi:hypothetical protein